QVPPAAARFPGTGGLPCGLSPRSGSVAYRVWAARASGPQPPFGWGPHSAGKEYQDAGAIEESGYLSQGGDRILRPRQERCLSVSSQLLSAHRRGLSGARRRRIEIGTARRDRVEGKRVSGVQARHVDLLEERPDSVALLWWV